MGLVQMRTCQGLANGRVLRETQHSPLLLSLHRPRAAQLSLTRPGEAAGRLDKAKRDSSQHVPQPHCWGGGRALTPHGSLVLRATLGSNSCPTRPAPLPTQGAHAGCRRGLV